MNILAVGDIVGSLGIQELQKRLQKVKQEYQVDFTIVNGENAADGMGLLEKQYKDILALGADVVTMGNHTWAKKEIFNFIQKHYNLIKKISAIILIITRIYMIFF